jgi:hypothetical protein
MNDNKNTILAIVLSALVLIGWQYFVGMPQEKSRQEQLQVQQQKQGAPTPAQPGQTPPAPAQSGTPQVPGQAAAPSAAAPVNRAAALAASPRVPIATDNVQGSIALKGGRIDDLALVRFRETVDPKSPAESRTIFVGSIRALAVIDGPAVHKLSVPDDTSDISLGFGASAQPTIYATSKQGVFVSTDGGATWSKSALPGDGGRVRPGGHRDSA